MPRSILFILLLLSSPALSNWPQFRGPNASGQAPDQNPPLTFSPTQNLLWKTPLPPGNSSPIIHNDHLFLTAHNKGKLLTLCLDRPTGQIKWQRESPPVEKIERSTNHGPATPTPCTDGQSLFVSFGSYGLLSYDFQGNERWKHPLPNAEVRHGTAASPVLVAGKLIVNCDQENLKSYLLALDPQTGQTLWKTPRPQSFSSHTTPIHWHRDDGADEILLAGSVRFTAYDAHTGKERWSSRGLEAISIAPTPILGPDNTVFAMSYSMGTDKLPPFPTLLESYDKNGDGQLHWNESPKLVKDVLPILDTNHDRQLSPAEWAAHYETFSQSDTGLFALKNPLSGDVTATHKLWQVRRNVSEVPSPLLHKNAIFLIQSGGLCSAYSPTTGAPIYERKRLAPPGNYFASPIATKDHIILASTTGHVTLLDTTTTPPTPLPSIDLSEPIHATPALSHHTLFIRTPTMLYAFGKR